MLRAPVTSAHAGILITVFAAATALTIAATRAFLDLSGYPSIGGSTYHLAHALWGGLLLMVACVLLLAVRGRWVEPSGAVVGGLGAGLFVDEVGKFITRSNDYFFPLAAPIVYICLVVLAFVAYRAGRAQRRTARSHLQAGIDLVRDAIDGPVTESRIAAVKAHAIAAQQLSKDPADTRLAEGLIALADARGASTSLAVAPWWARAYGTVLTWESQALPMPRFRRVLRGVLMLLSVSSIAGGVFGLPIAIGLAYNPHLVDWTFIRSSLTPGPVAFVLYALSAAATVVSGVLYGLASWALRPGRVDVAKMWRRSSVGVIVAMGVANAAGSYIDQFSSLTALVLNALLLAFLASYVSRSGQALG